MAQLELGELFARVSDRPKNGRAEGQRVERRARVEAARQSVRKLRGIYRRQALAARRLEEALTKELRMLE